MKRFLVSVAIGAVVIRLMDKHEGSWTRSIQTSAVAFGLESVLRRVVS